VSDDSEPDADPLALWPVVLSLPVLWGDQDAMGHVNNTVPIRWCESARVEYIERIGLKRTMRTERIGPILASIRCNYRRQIHFPDTVRIGARVTRLGRSSIDIEHAVFSQSQGMIVADAESVVVVFNYDTGKSHPIPQAMRSAIQRIEGRSFSD
jgi:acyl-CoA thioester hydrolase